jgi:methyl-accepting chemotaxis protein
MWIIFAIVLIMTATTVMSYGMTAKTLRCCVVLWLTLVITGAAFISKLDDLKKALIIVLVPTYASVVYSAAAGGNSISYLVCFITLGMAVRYFDNRIIKYVSLPYIGVSVVILVFDHKIIDPAFVASISKIVMFATSAILMYLGTKFGEKKINQAEEALGQVKENSHVANKIAENLNTEVVECDTQVQEVTGQAESVKSSAEQMEQVMDDSSRAIMRVSEKLNMAKQHIDKNYGYAQQLEKSFAEVNSAVADGNAEATTVKDSMNEMAVTIQDASDATSGLLAQMNEITGILNEINSIAGQTNLLSLNASIEAARAGEHGKGFAVVADQIRALSEDSKKSADSIKEIISTLTDTVNSVVDKISAGVNAARESSEKLENLIGQLENVNKSAEEATVVVKEEYDVIGNVKTEFDEIQEELDTVAATSEENASMVAEISNSIVQQNDYINKLSESVRSLKDSSEKLEEHFSE